MMKRVVCIVVCALACLFPIVSMAQQDSVTPGLTLWQLHSQTGKHMMSYVMKTAEGKLIVVDGGRGEDAEYLLKTIRDIRPDGYVDLWILTHQHSDHYGALAYLLHTSQDKFHIKTLCYSFLDREAIDRIEPVGKQHKEYRDTYYPVMSDFLHMKNVDELKRPHKNDRIMVGKVICTVMNDRCPNDKKYLTAVNDCSICWRIDTGKTSILFLGDMGRNGAEWLLASQKPETLQCDYTQVAHHGQWALSQKHYEVIRPKRCLWPTSVNSWPKDGDKNSQSGKFFAEETMKWMKELGVTEHYIAKDATIKLELP